MSIPVDIEGKLEYHFKDQQLLVRALTHPSAVTDGGNSRLKLLGSEAIRFAVVKELLARGPESPGVISKTRDGVHTRPVLYSIDSFLSLEKHLVISDSARRSNLPEAIAGSVEALVGAITVDGGYDALDSFTRRFLLPRIPDVPLKDSKTRLQELLHRKRGGEPEYRRERETGPQHRKTFVVGVYFNGLLLARGKGQTIKTAEKDAAEKVVAAMKKQS